MITYMDGSIELISDVGSKYRSMTLQNPPFVQQLAQYQAVYNYQDYLTYNPDLAALYGARTSSMKLRLFGSAPKRRCTAPRSAQLTSRCGAGGSVSDTSSSGANRRSARISRKASLENVPPSA